MIEVTGADYSVDSVSTDNYAPQIKSVTSTVNSAEPTETSTYYIGKLMDPKINSIFCSYGLSFMRKTSFDSIFWIGIID